MFLTGHKFSKFFFINYKKLTNTFKLIYRNKTSHSEEFHTLLALVLNIFYLCQNFVKFTFDTNFVNKTRLVCREIILN
jgi:hypothetical protein